MFTKNSGSSAHIDAKFISNHLQWKSVVEKSVVASKSDNLTRPDETKLDKKATNNDTSTGLLLLYQNYVSDDND